MIYRVSNSKIRDKRKEKGLSQEEFAAMLGIAVQTLRCIESGPKVPSAGLLRNIAVNLDCSMEYFVYEDTSA